MSLFSSIQLANNALHAVQVGLEVVGNNIANANTPGYIRERAVFEPAPTKKEGRLLLGMGVDVTGVVQEVDLFLMERLRAAGADLANGEAQEDAYLQLETLIGELSDTDLSTSLTNFFGGIHDILNQPENVTVRNLAVLMGKSLAADISRLSSRVREVRSSVNDRVIAAAADINRLLHEIAVLNRKIVTTESGGLIASDALGLRDQRQIALAELASLVDVRSFEQPSGAVSVFSGGDFLVFDNTVREVTTVTSTDRGVSVAEIRLTETDSPISIPSGELAGMLTSRDEILGGFLDQLDDFTSRLIFEFNKIHSSGQGLTGYEELTSEFAVEDAAAALDQAGLPFSPVNGSFQVQMVDRQTGLTETTDVFVRLNGLDDDTSLADLAAALDAIDGLAAATTPLGALVVSSDTPGLEFAFADDTSGVLAALGLNTFFSGSSAVDIAVNQVVLHDPAKFAASRAGIGADTQNAVLLADFLDAPLESLNGGSLALLYEQMTEETTQAASVSRSVTEGYRVFQRTLESQHLGLSGVSIDEEAAKMIAYQHVYQASARYIGVIGEMLEMLVNL